MKKISSSISLSQFHKIVLIIAFFFYLITAIHSKGYFHYDEHYQIIEFADLKLGLNAPSDLAWEYEAQIRPAIQPAICVVIFKTLHYLGVTDAYTLILSLRLLTLLISLTAINLFVRSSLHLVRPDQQKLYILLSYFLWFLPFLNVRFSSESWSGIFFIFAVAVLQQNLSEHKKSFALAGLLLGFSFLCRFQSAFLIAGLLAWYSLIHNTSKKNIGVVIGAACFVLLLGVAIDSWFYETFVFTPWNYFNINILKGAASAFGISPWYYYIEMILNATVLPVGCFILGCLWILIFKKPKLLLLWVILPFLIIHSFIPHKEDRFLFPLINFVPLLIVLGWQEIRIKYLINSSSRVRKLMIFIIAGCLIAINTIGITIMAFRSMGNGTKTITYYIHQNYREKPVNLIYDTYTNPYNPLYRLDLKETFYTDKNVREINMQELLKNKKKQFNKNETTLFVIETGSADYPDNAEIIKRFKLKPKIQSIPEWMGWVYDYDCYFKNDNVLMLYGNQ